MIDVILLMILGIALLFFDLFVPGVILSGAGTLAFLAATAVAFRDFGAVGGLAAFIVGMTLLAIMLWIEYGLLPKTKWGRRFFLDTAIDATSQPKASDTAVLAGRECVALTPLMPTGQVELDGRRYEALSLDGHVAKGERLKVTGAQNFSLTVTKLS